MVAPLFPEVDALMQLGGRINGYGALALLLGAGVLGTFGFRWWRSTAVGWLMLTVIGFVFAMLFGMATVYHLERDFLTTTQRLIVDHTSLEGDRSNDGLSVTYTTPAGKTFTERAPQERWYEHHNFAVNSKGSLLSNGVIGLASIVVHVGAWRGRCWLRRRRALAQSWPTES